MPRVEEWLGGFIQRHLSRCPRADWPEPGTDDEFHFFDAWRGQFVKRGVEERWADAASLDMAAEQPKFLSDHLPAILKLAVEYRLRDDAGATPGALAGPDAARVASRSCPECGGSGMAVRFVHEPILGRVKTAQGSPAPLGSSFAIPCHCPFGQLQAAGLRPQGTSASPPTTDRYPSLRLGPVPWSDGPDNQFRHRPSQWDDAEGRPIEAPVAITTPAELREATVGLAEASDGRPRRFVPPSSRSSRGGAFPALQWPPAASDPVIDREKPPKPPEPRPAPAAIPDIPEDSPPGWF